MNHLATHSMLKQGAGRATRRSWLLSATALAGAAWLGACGERGPLRIGFIGGMSGRVADLGIGGRNGAQLAVEDLNAQGGVAGRQIELLTRDDEQNDDIARRGLTELFAAKVTFVVGPMTSSVAVALVPLANERGIPLISPTSTTHELSGRDDAFFRVVPDAPSGARQQASHLLGRGLRRLVVVTDMKNRAFAQSWTQAAATHFVAGGGVLAKAIDFEAAPGLRFGELAQQIHEAAPDVVVVAASAADSAVLVQQLRRADSKAAVALSPWAGTEQLLQLGGRTLDGAVVAQYFDRNSQAPTYKAFVERYRKRFSEAPGFPAVNAYDAVLLGVAGVRTAGASGSLLAAVKAIRELDGLQRKVVIDASGDSRAPMFLTELREGAYVAVAGP